MRRTITGGLCVLAFAGGLSAQINAASGSAPAPAKALCRDLGPQGNWNETARFVAGMGGGAYAKELLPETQAAWATYSRSLLFDWNGLRRRQLDPIALWRNRWLDRKGSGGVAFYPFSGPDAVNVLAFFPDAREYVLMGLEPVGCVPASARDYTPDYFPDLRESLQTSITLGFFKTDDMRRAFRESEVRGVLPLLLVMLARSGYAIADVTAEGITPAGTLAPASAQVRRVTPGVAIRFQDSQHGTRVLRYFSANLENSVLTRNPGTVKYLENLQVGGTLVKSASYLMHKKYFSTVRGLILARGQAVVEDDSGIPFHFLDRAVWDVRLFGTYTKPIAMFAEWYQEDLVAAYAASKEPEPLEFGIGYKWQPKQSTLILGIRRGR